RSLCSRSRRRLRRIPLSPLFAYTTLFRSSFRGVVNGAGAHHQVNTRGHHGGGVNERRDRSGALHGVQQPALQRNLRRFTACTPQDRKSTRLNSSHVSISYAVFCSQKKKPE